MIDRVAAAFEAEGADAWFTSDPQRFLGNDHKAEDYEQVTDVVEVWFDSGSTHSFVLEARPDLEWPASLYLEGSDQHRGWFHSSLLESAGTRGRAPYDAVLTHGFVLDEDGRKMSKSGRQCQSRPRNSSPRAAPTFCVSGSSPPTTPRISASGPEILQVPDPTPTGACATPCAS